MAARDYAFEALAEVTATDWTTGRGELNKALQSIREESEVTDSYILADLIHERARLYREVMPDAILTASALAKHWKRVFEESSQRRKAARGTNLAAYTACETCGGDRHVLVALRRPAGSPDMQRRGNTPSPDEMHEEYAPCPYCNSAANTYFDRPDGTKFRSPDPGAVREMMRG